MKIMVRNLGVIGEAEVDLKPLTIFVGPNNTGKTWLAYTLASIFGPSGFADFLKASEEGLISFAYAPLDNAVKQVLNRGNTTIDLVQFAKEYGETYFNDVARSARCWMSEYMSTQIASFEHLDISIDLAESKTEFLERVLNYSLRVQIPARPQKPLLSIRKNRGEEKLYIYTSTQFASSEDLSEEEQIVEPLPTDIIKDFLIQNVLVILHRALFPYVRILPTERTTFITFPFTRNKRRNKEHLKIDEEPPKNLNARRLTGAVSYFLNMMHNTYDDEAEESIQRAKSVKNNLKIKKYIQLAQLLEDQILSGKVEFTQLDPNLPSEIAQSQLDEQEFAREVLFQPNKANKLEISIASSMVKELSPLVLYLRYLARPGELLVIDEPEMNLHPEAQVKMIEFLTILTNAGLKVLITTHSPYVIDHLTNLIKASEAENKESICNDFYLKRTDAFIPKENVSVYLFDQGQVKKAMDEDGTIELNTFGQVSDHISDIYFNL